MNLFRRNVASCNSRKEGVDQQGAVIKIEHDAGFVRKPPPSSRFLFPNIPKDRRQITFSPQTGTRAYDIKLS